MRVKNRIPGLLHAVKRTLSRSRADTHARACAKDVCENAINVLREHSPVDTYPPAPKEGRRKRPPHVPIKEGWVGPFVASTGSGEAVGRVENLSEHVGVQRTGLVNHVIYGIQAFWYPLKGPGSAKGSYTVVDFTEHTFPPWGESDFVVRAMNEVRSDNRNRFSTTGRTVALWHLGEFFGK